MVERKVFLFFPFIFLSLNFNDIIGFGIRQARGYVLVYTELWTIFAIYPFPFICAAGFRQQIIHNIGNSLTNQFSIV